MCYQNRTTSFAIDRQNLTPVVLAVVFEKSHFAAVMAGLVPAIHENPALSG